MPIHSATSTLHLLPWDTPPTAHIGYHFDQFNISIVLPCHLIEATIRRAIHLTDKLGKNTHTSILIRSKAKKINRLRNEL